jgi:prepilin-type N-terminal cleavage/methylation domain-containing protein
MRRTEFLRKRLTQARADEAGFTLVELIIVVQIVGILMAIALPSFLGYKVRANKRTASADVRSAIPVAELYYTDPTKGALSYKNLSLAAMQAMDPGVKLDGVVVSTDFSTYCLHQTVGGRQSLVIRGTRLASSGYVQEDVAGACPVSGLL